MNLLQSIWASVNIEEILDGSKMKQILEVDNKIFLAIRIVLTLIAAALGWFLSGPVWRGLYYLVIHKAMPFLLQAPLRLLVACVLAAIVFFYAPIGLGGLGGLGSGGGQGDGTGKGKGTGSETGTGTGTSTTPNPNKTNDPNQISGKNDNSANPPDSVDFVKFQIRVLGGPEYRTKDKGYIHGKDKFYLVRIGKDDAAAKTFKEVEALFEERKNVQVSVEIQRGEGVDTDVTRLEEAIRARKESQKIFSKTVD